MGIKRWPEKEPARVHHVGAVLPRFADAPSFRAMSIVAAKKKSARKPAPQKTVKVKKAIPSWIGSGVGKGFVKPGVDLTKPTLSPDELL